MKWINPLSDNRDTKPPNVSKTEYEEDQPNLGGTNNRGGTKQQRWTKDYIKASFEASIYNNQTPFKDKNYVKAPKRNQGLSL